MRKVVKIFMVVAVMFMLVFTLTSKVNAVVFDASGYNEIAGDEKTENTTKNEVKEETKQEDTKKETETKSDTATTSIIQAGSITTITCVAIAGVTVASIVFGYKKVKEYNF